MKAPISITPFQRVMSYQFLFRNLLPPFNWQQAQGNSSEGTLVSVNSLRFSCKKGSSCCMVSLMTNELSFETRCLPQSFHYQPCTRLFFNQLLMFQSWEQRKKHGWQALVTCLTNRIYVHWSQKISFKNNWSSFKHKWNDIELKNE